MTSEEKGLIAWAAQEIRELDELCRAEIPGYASLDSQDMIRVKALERLAVGQEAGVAPDLRPDIADTRNNLSMILYHISRGRLDLAKAGVEDLIHYLGTLL